MATHTCPTWPCHICAEPLLRERNATIDARDETIRELREELRGARRKALEEAADMDCDRECYDHCCVEMSHRIRALIEQEPTDG